MTLKMQQKENDRGLFIAPGTSHLRLRPNSRSYHHIHHNSRWYLSFHHTDKDNSETDQDLCKKSHGFFLLFVLHNPSPTFLNFYKQLHSRGRYPYKSRSEYIRDPQLFLHPFYMHLCRHYSRCIFPYPL